MSTRAIAIENVKTGEVTEAVYEHPFVVRLCHWVNVVSLFVLVGSGLQIFRAFPSFGAKIPQKDLLHWPKAFALGGWLGGALQWHLTFMWIYMATGLLYLGRRAPPVCSRRHDRALCRSQYRRNTHDRRRQPHFRHGRRRWIRSSFPDLCGRWFAITFSSDPSHR